MKTEIVEAIQKAVDGFVKHLLSIESKGNDKLREVDRNIENLRKKEEEVKVQIEESKLGIEGQKDAITKEVKKLKALQGEVTKELGIVETAKVEAYKAREKARDNAHSVDVELKLASEGTESIRDKTKKLDSKIKALTADEKELDKKRQDIIDREKKLSARENLLEKREIEIINKEDELVDRELALNTNETNVNREIKRLKLKKVK